MRLNVIIFLCIALSLQVYAGSIEKEFEREYDLSENGIVSVKNVNGKLFVESWDQDKVKVFAEITVKAGSRRDAEHFMDKVKIEVRRKGDQISIQPDYPHHKDSFFNMFLGHKKPSVKVDFTIQVPRFAEVTAHSVNGTVQVQDIGGPADLEAVNGGIRARKMNNIVNAKTTNGGISVEIDKQPQDGELDLHTVNGSIELFLPSNIDADVRMSTVNGSIKTDFPIKVDGEIGSKRMRGTINNGGPEIMLKTVNGSIRLQEL